MVLLFALGVGFALSRATPAQAHGKEVEIGLACRAADPSRPLARRCEATVVFTTDRDPVTDARLVLRATRAGRVGQGVDEVELSAIGPPGRYAATFTLPSYGTWQTTVAVLAPGEGHVELSQEVLPPSLDAAPEGRAQVRLVVGFQARDAANIGVLVFHLLGASGILVANGAVFIGAFLPAARDIRNRRAIVRVFSLVAAGSVGVLVLSGLYSARFNAPTRAPGLFRPRSIGSLPFGGPYLAVFGVKMALAVVLMVGTGVLARRLRGSSWWSTMPESIGPVALATGRLPLASRLDGCTRLAAANLITGGALLVVVIVVDYLHLLTHAGAFVGP